MASVQSPPFFEDDLSAEDDEILSRERIVLQKAAGGKRTVNAALLSPPSSHNSIRSSSASSVFSSASVRFQSSFSTDGAFVLPEHMISVAAIQFCGFTHDSAIAIYTRFLSRPDIENNPDDLLDYMQAEIQQADFLNVLDPQQAMDRMGLSKDTQLAILNPLYDEIRRT